MNKKDRAMTPTEFVKQYEIDTTLSERDRGTNFLIAWAAVAPGRYMDRRLLAKVAYNLGSVPNEGSHVVAKRLPGLWQRIKERLLEDYGTGWDSDILEGVRATYSDKDFHETNQKFNRKRAALAVGRLQRTTAAIDAIKLPAELRREHEQDVVGSRTLAKGISQLALSEGEKPKEK
jgi:hypothetical protein